LLVFSERGMQRGSGYIGIDNCLSGWNPKIPIKKHILIHLL